MGDATTTARVCLATMQAFIGSLILIQPASAVWLEASSDHFVVYADTSEKDLREFASRLERFDKGLRFMFKPAGTEDEGRRSNLLRIYVAPNASGVRKVLGKQRDVLGFYMPRIGGSMAFVPKRTGYDSVDLNSERVLFHEYAHHFMQTNFPAAYPPWFSEGFAELSSTAQFEKTGALGIGLSATHRAYGLFRGEALTTQQLLDSAAQRRNSMETEALYGRGWLLTHYLIVDTERRKQLGKYLDAVADGKPSIEAGKEAFGDLRKMDRALDAYMRSSTLKYLPIPADKLSIGPIDIRPLSPGAAAMMPVHMRFTRGVSREAALALLPEARRRAAPYPEDSVAQAQLAEAEYDARNYAEAEAAADRALKNDPKNIRALLYKGRIAMHRALEAKTTDKQTWSAVRRWFITANGVDSNAAEPLFLFYQSFNAADVKPTENAVLALNRAFELSPEDPKLRTFVAYQALRDNKPRLARFALAPIAFDPHGGEASAKAATIVGLIDAGKTDEAIEAMSGGGEESEEAAD